jgi:chromate reductase
MNELRVVGIAGSLRERSYNRALLRAAIERAPESMRVETFDLRPVPMYNADVEAEGDPEPVEALKTSIRGADLVVLVTPEYNGLTTGAMKNAIDWASRPPRPQAWDGKPVVLMGATPGRLATLGAQESVRVALGKLNAIVMPQPRILISGAGSLFDDDVRLVDEDTLERLDKFMVAAAEWAHQFRAG